MVLAEDGTIVDDEDYFLCLPSNTKFVALAEGERWSGRSAGSGGAGRPQRGSSRRGGAARRAELRGYERGCESERSSGPQKGAKLPQILRPRSAKHGGQAEEPHVSQ